MQFVPNGPEVPDLLLQAHEDGRVVFFCGAGISYPAGLPDYRGLIDQIYQLVRTQLTPLEADAYNHHRYDAVLDLLERRLPGQRLAVRTAAAQALRPNLRRKGATQTHRALLQLSRARDGAVRLVTTNFDRVFERVLAGAWTVPGHPAPLLPIPKSSRWDGIVYLHGLLPKRLNPSALNRLVLTSGDFSLAYLTERWASRFVTELFRNYVVCFVGYGINDPVLRYMMDALAADRTLGETTPASYAFADYSSGMATEKGVEWGAKGVTPILYERRPDDEHSALHRTLKSWAETYRDGVLGRERLIASYAIAKPSASTKQDDFVSRMLWALSHESGLPARRFAEFTPTPALDWLEAFSSTVYGHADLNRFGIGDGRTADGEVRFSLIQRPAPHTRTSWMGFVGSGSIDTEWDRPMFELAPWLVRHLDDPALIFWLAERGGQLHWRLARQVERQLDTVERLEQAEKLDDLVRLRAESPGSVPRPFLRPLWRLIIAGRVKSSRRDSDLYTWKDRFSRDGLTTVARITLRELLTPRIHLRKPFRWTNEEVTDQPQRLRQVVDWELDLTADHVGHVIDQLESMPQWQKSLRRLLTDFQQLLLEAVEILKDLGEAGDLSDHSYWDLPSVFPHWQNRGFKEWVLLIELTRDAWERLNEERPAEAAHVAADWFEFPYPTFKRLAFFAAAKNNSIPQIQWVDWLLAADAWWLWAFDTMREVLRLLVLRGHDLSDEHLRKLESAILAGPPRQMYRTELESDRWDEVVKESVWLRLAKLQSSGAQLSPDALARLESLTASQGLSLANDERDEFSHWMSGTGDPGYERHRDVEQAPRRRQELVTWLIQPVPADRPFYEDTWRDTCLSRFYHSVLALCDLAEQGSWPGHRWRTALQAWSDASFVNRSWRWLASAVAKMPAAPFQESMHAVAWWLQSVAPGLNRHEATFFSLCERILELPHEGLAESDEPVGRAINHPVGYVANALLERWSARKPNDADGIPGDLIPLFARIAQTSRRDLRHGRVILASRLIFFFRVDATWTTKHLIPLLDWNTQPAEARAAWDGFLWSPRLYRPLLVAIREQLLDTARHYSQLGKDARQYATFLTLAALERPDTYSPSDFAAAFGALPQAGLEDAGKALMQAMESAGDQREEYWENRVLPFWSGVWPKSLQVASKDIAESLSRLVVATGVKFPEALETLQPWIHPVDHPDFIVYRLHESGVPKRFPRESLALLNSILGKPDWIPSELGNCLEELVLEAPSLVEDARYKRLLELVRQHRG